MPPSFYCPTVTLEASRTFLAQVAAREPNAIHVVVWDGAGFHPGDGGPGSAGQRALDRVAALPPGVKPGGETLDQLKDRLCNRVFANLASLEAVMTDFLRAFWQHARRVVSLIWQDWRRTQSRRFFGRHYTGKSS
jgi:hypothetical protein